MNLGTQKVASAPQKQADAAGPWKTRKNSYRRWRNSIAGRILEHVSLVMENVESAKKKWSA